MNPGSFNTKRKWGIRPRRPGNLKFHPMYVESLEDRRVMSAVSPLQAAALETSAGVAGTSSREEMISSSAFIAPAVPRSEPMEGTASQGSAAALFVTDTQGAPVMPLGAGLTTPPFSALTPEEYFETGGIPGRLVIPGIPPGDAGGMAGANGGGRLPLEIPGFSGYGNAYYLSLSGETIGRIVWLYAEYFGNQQRVVPQMTVLPRAGQSVFDTNFGQFGTTLASPVFYFETPLFKEKKRDQDIHEDEKKEPNENQIEHYLNQQLERTFQNLLRRKEYLEKRRSPEPYELQQPLYPGNVPIPYEIPAEKGSESAPSENLEPDTKTGPDPELGPDPMLEQEFDPESGTDSELDAVPVKPLDTQKNEAPGSSDESLESEPVRLPGRESEPPRIAGSRPQVLPRTTDQVFAGESLQELFPEKRRR